MNEGPSERRTHEIEARFGSAAKAYAASPGHKGGPDLDRMIEMAKPTRNDVVLDVATGAGHTALAFALLVSRVDATDLSPSMTAMAATLAQREGLINVEVKTVGVEQLHVLGSEIYDLVTCRIAPHHFEDLDLAMREIALVMKTHARFVCVDSRGFDEPDVFAFLHDAEVVRDPTHVKSRTVAEWTASCEQAGLVVEHTEAIPKRLEFEPWLERAGCTDAVKDELRSRFRSAPEAVARRLRIEVESDSVVAFTDEKLLLVARKRVPN